PREAGDTAGKDRPGPQDRGVGRGSTADHGRVQFGESAFPDHKTEQRYIPEAACPRSTVPDSSLERMSASTSDERPTTVGEAKRVRSFRSTANSSRIRAISCVPSNEWPPIRKKFSLMSTASRPRREATICWIRL